MQATQQSASPPVASPDARGTYAEVWGDIVDLKHLGLAVVIGGALSLATFLICIKILSPLAATAALGRSYAMLAGLIGCVVSGVICARLFEPKRIIVETETDPAWRMETMDQLAAEEGSIGNIADLSPAVAAEMKELGLYDLFASYDVNARRAAGHKAAGKPQSTIG